jgi:hypothetical protein
MALSDTIKLAVAEAPLNATCTVKKALEKLVGEDKEVAEKALYDRNIKASVLGRAFKKENIDITTSTITRHRNGGCLTCAK